VIFQQKLQNHSITGVTEQVSLITIVSFLQWKTLIWGLLD